MVVYCLSDWYGYLSGLEQSALLQCLVITISTRWPGRRFRADSSTIRLYGNLSSEVAVGSFSGEMKAVRGFFSRRVDNVVFSNHL